MTDGLKEALKDAQGRQTNFDRITQSPEVLAGWLNKFVCFPCELCKHWNSRCEFYAQGKRYCAVQTDEDEEKVWLEWLKQERSDTNDML